MVGDVRKGTGPGHNGAGISQVEVTECVIPPGLEL